MSVSPFSNKPLPSIVRYLSDRNQTFLLDRGEDLSARLCRAWFITKAGPDHPDYERATELARSEAEHPVMRMAALFEKASEQEIPELISLWGGGSPGRLPDKSGSPLWALFSPEANECLHSPEQVKERIAEKRSLSDLSCPAPLLTDIASELLFTSNVLLTVPLPGDDLSHLDLNNEFFCALSKVQSEPQRYWYDHPIPVGIAPEENEILYGLENLDRAIDFERERGNIKPDAKVSILLSVSVTHQGLSPLAKEYVEYEISRHLKLRNLEVTVFSEQECRCLLKAAFPETSESNPSHAVSSLEKVFGVDGFYGRHYTFLKAIAAMWQKHINPALKATFKIDLDQVFPQQELVSETGKSAFEHFLCSGWGGDATDSEGEQVHLGMIAGGLVNESDIKAGLFTPDVTAPEEGDYAPFEQLFCSRWPQALSTQAEILSRSPSQQRVHVTGGTNGISVEALYRYRPFTPTFVHRAEDQAFILSSLSVPEGEEKSKEKSKGTGKLAYLHLPGLIMRHDKDAFAGRAMKQASAGKALGDTERVLLFSYYARHLPLSLPQIREKLYPFTSSFITSCPVTLALLRFMLEGADRGEEYTDSGALRLMDCLNYCRDELAQELEQNQAGWNEYYSVLANSDGINNNVVQVFRSCLLDV